MSYYMRKNNRRATVDAAIDDNWVELNAPELALATSAPAIDSFAGGRTGTHIGRIGVTLSNAVPHGISQANSMLHAQTARRGTRTSSIFHGSNSWKVWNGERKDSNKTLSAVAVASNVAAVFAFAPDPGSRRQAKSKWFDILPEEQVEFVGEVNDYAGSSEGSSISDGGRTATTDSDPLFSPGCVTNSTPDTEVALISPTCVRYGIPPPIQIPNTTISHAGRRATSLPLPSGYVQPDAPESGQIIMIEAKAPLFESPAPFTSNTIASFSDQQREPSASMTSARSIVEGLRRLFDVVDRQTSMGYASTVPSPQNAEYPQYSADFPIPIDDHEWEMCNLTPATAASSWYTADPRERKLLIIGSGYDSANFRQATTETNATSATLNTLCGVSHDVKSLTSVFKKRSFVVETLVGDSFDAQTVLNRVKMFLRDGTEGDVRAIIFTGHAARTHTDHKVAIVPPAGCRSASDPDKGLISADAWRAAVNDSTQPGVIVLSIFASCMSGDLMNQPVNLKDLNDPITTGAILPDPQAAAPAPIFITFASSRSDQSTYESVVGPSPGQDAPFRYGDHFLRAFTLAARETCILDWKDFIRSLEEKFSQLRMIGAFCAAHDPDIRDSNWLETHPQTPVYTFSRSKLPPLEDVMPWGISLVEREPPTPGFTKPINLTEEFLAHISLRGETPEITHYTLPTPSNVVPPVVL